jgi:hypothetical protein
VFFEGRVAHALRNSVVGNTVGMTAVAGLHALGVIAPAGALTVADNWVTTTNAGIEVGPSGYVVRDNDVRGSVESTGAGIAVSDAGLFAALRGATRIAGNRVRTLGGVGVAVNAPVADLVVTENVVEDAQQGIVMDRKAETAGAIVSGNVVRDVGARESEDGTVAGIQVVRADRAVIESNTVVGVGAARTARDSAVGIAVLACADSRVAGNCVDHVGFDQAPGRAIGIAVVGLARTDVHGNSSRRSDVDVDEDPTSEWIGLLLGPAVGEQVTHETIGSFSAVTTAGNQYLVGAGAAYAAAADVRDETVTMSDNIVTGGGATPAIRALVRGEVALATNQAQQRRETDIPAVLVQAEAATVSTNVAKGGRPSVRLLVDPKRVAVLGNLTATGIEVSGAALSAPWAPLNPSGVV